MTIRARSENGIDLAQSTIFLGDRWNLGVALAILGGREARLEEAVAAYRPALPEFDGQHLVVVLKRRMELVADGRSQDMARRVRGFSGRNRE